MKLKLIDKKPESPNAITFYFSSDEDIEWKPGQYLRYRINQNNPDERGENRFFSIASAPFEKHIQLTTKIDNNNGSTLKDSLQKLEIGEEVEVFGPMGHFTTEESYRDLVLIAGGIGITPFRAILLDLDHQKKLLNVSLIYASKTSDVIFKKEIEDLANHHPEFKIYYVVSDPNAVEEKLTENIEVIKGRVDEDLIRKLVSDLQKPIYYISGPESMVMELERVIWDMGVSRSRTRQDYFSGYEKY